ncbi:MAG TPA: hypothetical protein VFP27_00380, partial [Mycobacterium sp.]|nr:hypothetical protein [Mycobacterium sp.]
MIDRFFLWLGAGVVAAGVTVGMLAGAGAAQAHTESDSDGGVKTSQAAKSDENKQDSGKNDAGQDRQQKQNVNDDKNPNDPAVGADDQPDAKVVERGRKSLRSEAGKRTAKLINNVVAALTPKPARKVVAEKADPVETVETEAIVTGLSEPEPPKAEPKQTPAIAQTGFRLARAPPTETDIALAMPMPARPESAASAAPPIQVPPVVSAIGTAVFDLISFAESVFEGPPKVPPGSSVTVQRSTLDLGNGHVVPADWYFPEGTSSETAEDPPPPERIIYLQHGLLARGVFYDYTAAYLAEQTNSVVVAPSLTSNIFATDGMWLGGEQMHRAVADLLLDNNDALLESAQLAGYPEGQELPKQVVLVGHSLGGGLIIDTARYMARDEELGDSSYQLAGVLMLDGVSFTDPVPILEQIPDDIPIYNLSATPYLWNLFGSMDHALAQVRGDDFTGAQLLGGLHSDAMIGGNPLIQFGAYLLTGFSRPSNVEGSQILAAGWINDMFGGTLTPGLYGAPGSTIKVPTGFGPAFGLVQPTPGPIDTVARQLTAVFFGLLSNIDFATDVPAAGAAVAVPTAVAAGATNGVTGVQVGHSDLEIACGPDGY